MTRKILITGKFEIARKWGRPDYICEYTGFNAVLVSGIRPERIQNRKFYERTSDGSTAIRISETEFEIVGTRERVLIQP